MTKPDTFVKLKNPYTFGVPVRGEGKFFGREAELRLIFDTLENVPRGQKQDLVVLGPRRIGKSSLLYRLVDLLTQRATFVPVYIDLQSIKPRRTRLLFKKILREIKHGYHKQGLISDWPTFKTLETEHIPPDEEFLTFSEELDRLNAAIADRDLPRLALMFDEVELLVDFGGDDTLGWFRSLIQSLLYTVFVVAGSDRLYALTQDYGSPLYNIFKTVELRPLTEEAAHRLLEEPSRGIGMIIAPPEVDTILRYAGKNPYFIQGIAHYLVEELNRQERYQVYPQDVNRVLKASVQDLSAQFIYFWNNVTQRQRVILYVLARCLAPRTVAEISASIEQLSSLVLSEKELQDELDDLVHGQILCVETAKHYWFVILLFANWIVSEINEDEITKSTPDATIVQANIIYNDTAIQEMLDRAFSNHELRRFIFDYFKQAYDQIPDGISKDQMITRFLDYIRKTNQHERLFSEIEWLKPDYYERFSKDAVSIQVDATRAIETVPSEQASISHSLEEVRLLERLDRRRLLAIITSYFNLEELRTLYFDLGIDYDSLSGMGKGGKARELIMFMERHGRLDELVRLITEYRPSINLDQ
jgi:AAA+ ATPase superfamily predicted ATPase